MKILQNVDKVFLVEAKVGTPKGVFYSRGAKLKIGFLSIVKSWILVVSLKIRNDQIGFSKEDSKNS